MQQHDGDTGKPISANELINKIDKTTQQQDVHTFLMNMIDSDSKFLKNEMKDLFCITRTSTTKCKNHTGSLPTTIEINGFGLDIAQHRKHNR